MNRPALFAGLLTALLAGAGLTMATPALAADDWKVMTPVQLEAAAEAALPTAGQVAAGRPAVGAPADPPATEGAPTEGVPPADPLGAMAAENQPLSAAVPAVNASGGGGAGAAATAAKPLVEKPDGPAYLAEDQPFKLKDYEEPKPQATTPWWQQLLGMVIKLVIVLGLVAASMVGMKKFSGGKLPLGLTLGAKGRNLVVLETTSLGPNQSIHMVCVGGDRILVVGAGPQGLTTLATIDDPSQVRVLMAATKVPSTAFNQVYDMETVVQDADADLYRGAIRDVSRRGGWGG